MIEAETKWGEHTVKLVLAEELETGMTLAQDIFLSQDDVSPFVRRGIVLTEYVIRQIKKRGITNIYIQSDEPEEEMRQPASATVIDSALKQDALDKLEDIFTDAIISEKDIHTSSAQVITQLDSVVDKLVESLLTEKAALVNINDLKSYDDYTYHHSLSVAVLSIAIGQYLGYDNPTLHRMGMSAIMHDIGKTAIPVEIIRKTARLTDEEFDLIKTHSAAGYDYLRRCKLGDGEVLRAVLHHHEKMDGSGYPKGIKGPEIPEWSRIITVADVYDALTSNRPYRRPMEPADAIEYIMGGAGTAFDFDMVTALVKKVDLYPIGSDIELSDGRVAKVVDNENQMRPVVQLENSGEFLDLYRDRKCLSIVIKRVLPNVLEQKHA